MCLCLKTYISVILLIFWLLLHDPHYKHTYVWTVSLIFIISHLHYFFTIQFIINKNINTFEICIFSSLVIICRCLSCSAPFSDLFLLFTCVLSLSAIRGGLFWSWTKFQCFEWWVDSDNVNTSHWILRPRNQVLCQGLAALLNALKKPLTQTQIWTDVYIFVHLRKNIYQMY